MMTNKPVRDLLDLSGHAAVVTGGAMGIGLGIARRLAEAGAGVLLADLDDGAAKLAADDLVAAGGRATSTHVDVADEASVEAMFARATRDFGTPDILVNNAGIYPNAPLSQLEPEDFDRILDVNLRGVYLCMRRAAALMVAQGTGGSIVNVTSIDAVHPSMVGLAAYDASKHGVWGLTKNAALEFAPLGIRVNAVAPGGITTPGVSKLTVAPGEDAQALVDAFLARIPMRRMGEPDEIGTVVLFLVSEMAAYMTGSQVVVDGGALLA